MRRSTTGYSLIEVLIALVILSVGLLGLAGLQSASMKSNDDAYLRSQATLLAYNIVDAMRANHQGTIEGDYNIKFADDKPTGDCVQPADPCNPGAVANADTNHWLTRLADELPEGDGQIQTAASGTMTSVTVKVQWYTQLGNDTESISVKTLL